MLLSHFAIFKSFADCFMYINYSLKRALRDEDVAVDTVGGMIARLKITSLEQFAHSPPHIMF